MKARVKANGVVIDVILSHITHDNGKQVVWFKSPTGASFYEDELEFIEDEPDYWTRLEHQYAGMAMHALTENGIRAKNREIAGMAAEIAHELVEKLKSNN